MLLHGVDSAFTDIVIKRELSVGVKHQGDFFKESRRYREETAARLYFSNYRARVGSRSLKHVRMRYMQMIKRCKIPFEGMKKAGPDLEASGEEPAKRCRMSAPDLKTPNWEERLGPLRNSAVARLLVEGKLSSDYPSPLPPTDPHVAMDLSKTATRFPAMHEARVDQLIKTEPTECGDTNGELLRKHMRDEMDALKCTGPLNDGGLGGWKCRYCPYTAHTSKTLYSHYQFHQQLLTSQSSKPHIEWLAAYRKAKEPSEDGPLAASPMATSPAAVLKGPNGYPISPGGIPPLTAPPGFSLRCLLGGQAPQQAENQHSASGFLRSIVQAVMQQGGNPGKAQSTTSIYASLVNGSANGACASPNSSTCSGVSPSSTETTPERTTLGSHVNGAGRVVEEDEVARETVVVSVIDDLKENSRHGGHDLLSDEGKNIYRSSNGISESQNDVSIKQLIPPRPPSRNSYTSESSDSSSSSEEINVDDVDIPAFDIRHRTSSCPSEAVDRQGALGPLGVSRKRSYSLESAHSGIPSRYLRPEFDKVHGSGENKTGYDVLNESVEYDGLSAAKSPRLDPPNSPPRSRDGQASGYRSPKETFSPLRDPRMANGVSDCDNSQSACAVFPGRGSDVWMERSTQCELLIPPGDHHVYDGTESLTLGRSVPGCIKCPHCGIIFEDSVLHSIHMGCHNHSDPFVCNVCGEQCANKYGFYTHIMRGHHNRSSAVRS